MIICSDVLRLMRTNIRTNTAGPIGAELQFWIASATKTDVCMTYHASRGRHESVRRCWSRAFFFSQTRRWMEV